MKVLCAECGKLMGEIPSIHDAELDPPVSHGLCQTCALKLYGRLISATGNGGTVG